MLALNALVSCWIECVRKDFPGVIPRAYDDDISATVKAKTQKLLKKKLKEVHAVTTKYEKVTGVRYPLKRATLSAMTASRTPLVVLTITSRVSGSSADL